MKLTWCLNITLLRTIALHQVMILPTEWCKVKRQKEGVKPTPTWNIQTLNFIFTVSPFIIF